MKQKNTFRSNRDCDSAETVRSEHAVADLFG